MAAADSPAAAEVAATAAWFHTIEFPDLRGKEYVEMTYGTRSTLTGEEDGPKVRGFLLEEDETGITLIADGSFAHRSFSGRLWPMLPINYWTRSGKRRGDVDIRTIPLDDAVAEALEDAETPMEPGAKRSLFQLDHKVSAHTSLFLLARFCEKQGRTDLAAKLDAMVIEVFPTPGNGRLFAGERDASNDPSFRGHIERELAHVLMWKSIVDFNDLRYTRPQLLTGFERLIRDFPASEHVDRASEFAKMLRSMIAEDERAAEILRQDGREAGDAQARELVFQLRDQSGVKIGQPGPYDIFGGRGSRSDQARSPAHELVKLGFAAVPALVKALDDPRFTRCVNYHRDFRFSHRVLTIGDCARILLSRIADREFRDAASEGEVRAAIKAWWSDVQERGPSAVLSEDVRAGTSRRAEQAKRRGQALNRTSSPGFHAASADSVPDPLVPVSERGVESRRSKVRLQSLLDRG